MSEARLLIDRLGLKPHPEGGHYAETWRDSPDDGERGAGTAIYYLLQAGERSHWHRVDAAEIWHFYAGDPLRLRLWTNGEAVRQMVLGPDVAAGHMPQVIISPGEWQAADPLGAWTLAGCTVSPAFRFEGFEMAPPGWEPPS